MGDMWGVAKCPAFLQLENKNSRSDQTVRAFKRDVISLTYTKRVVSFSASSDLIMSTSSNFCQQCEPRLRLTSVYSNFDQNCFTSGLYSKCAAGKTFKHYPGKNI